MAPSCSSKTRSGAFTPACLGRGEHEFRLTRSIADYASLAAATMTKTVPRRAESRGPDCAFGPGVLHQVLVLQCTRRADPRQPAGQRHPQAKQAAAPCHWEPALTGLDAVSLSGLPSRDDVDHLNSVSGEPETPFLGWSLGLYPNIKYLRLPLATPYAPTAETAMGDAALMQLPLLFLRSLQV